jgi:hypothetical protein
MVEAFEKNKCNDNGFFKAAGVDKSIIKFDIKN